MKEFLSTRKERDAFRTKLQAELDEVGKRLGITLEFGRMDSHVVYSFVRKIAKARRARLYIINDNANR